MVRKVTLNPLNIVLKVSKTSRIGDAMTMSLSNAAKWSNLWSLNGLSTRRCQCQRNLFAVKPAVLDEDFARMPTADYHSGQVHSRNIALVSLRIHGWLSGYRIQPHA